MKCLIESVISLRNEGGCWQAGRSWFLAKHLPEATYAQLDQARVTLAEHRGGAEAAERLQAEFDERFGELKWVSAGEMLPGGTVCHKISHSDLTTRDTREQREFNFATGQVI